MADTLYSNATPANVGDILTTTANARNKEIVDLYFNKYPLVTWFETKAKEMVDGGQQIEVPIEYAKNNTVGFIAPNGSVNTAVNPILTTAYFKPCFMAGAATISLDDMSANNGESKLADLIELREKNLSKTASEIIARGFYDEAPSQYAMNTLLEIIATTDPSAARGNLGQIDRDTYSWWQSNSTSVGSSISLLPAIETMQRSIAPSQGMDVPEAAFTTPTVFGYLSTSSFNRVRLSNESMAKLGFENIKVGKTEIYYDEFCPSGYMFFLNSQYIKMKIYKTVNKKFGPYVQPVNQWNYTRLFAHKFQIVVTDPDKLGVLTGITA